MAKTVTTIDVQKLRNVISNIDSVSRDALEEIEAIAKLALRALETPEGSADVESLAIALRAISSRAFLLQNDIGVETESVGCDHHDEAMERIHGARHACTSRRAVGA